MSRAEHAAIPVHRLHDDEIERLLVTGERRDELIALLGEAAYLELRRLARRAAATRPRARRPVYVLPGLMGSRIGKRGRLLDDVLWIDLAEIAAGRLVGLALPRGAQLVALGAMLLNALKLKLSLQVAGFSARFHAFDWRMDVDSLATTLVSRLDDDGADEVMLVGHSMGGLVARAALARRPQKIARVVQIGAPNFGSYAPVLALRGVYPTVRKLAALDQRHSAEDYARLIFRTLPSLHELLPSPLRSPDVDLFDVANWPDDELRPRPAMLSAGLTAQLKWPHADPRCLHIVGMRQDTVTAVRRRSDTFDFVVTPDGDGTVPLSMAVLPGSQVWYIAEKHGGLPNNGRVISAVVDLLRDGTTDRLPRKPRRARRTAPGTGLKVVSEAGLRRVAPHKVRWQDLSPDARRRLLEPVVSPEFHGGVSPEALRPALTDSRPSRERRRLEIRLSPSSIADAGEQAIVLGVFRSVDPSGASAAVDARLGGAIRELALRRMFGGQLGQVYLLPATRTSLRAEFVVFAGLGEFSGLGTEALAFVAENAARTLAGMRTASCATVLMGAGSGVPVARALAAQLRGTIEGLRRSDPDRRLQRITICEIDAGKFRSLAAAVKRFARELHDDEFSLVVTEERRPPGPRIPARATSAAPRPDPAYLLVNLLDRDAQTFDCRVSLLTAGAKAGVLSAHRQVAKSRLRALLAPLLVGAAPDRELVRIGRQLSALLIGPSVRDGLDDMLGRPLVVVHDREASQIPWELLRSGDDCPALTGGLSRRYTSDTLTAARWRAPPSSGDPVRVLLVADPTQDLPSAAAEGAHLQRELTRAGVEVCALTGRRASRTQLLRALQSGAHHVLHFAGHGYFDSEHPERSGLVCADGELLRGPDLDEYGALPALVFFNACEAARVRGQRRAPRNTVVQHSIAEAFLTGGVANFIGTHWPVGDDAARDFSTTLYAQLIEGHALGAAILTARRRLHASGSPDWADYVHYGNPAFALDPGSRTSAALQADAQTGQTVRGSRSVGARVRSRRRHRT